MDVALAEVEIVVVGRVENVGSEVMIAPPPARVPMDLAADPEVVGATVVATEVDEPMLTRDAVCPPTVSPPGPTTPASAVDAGDTEESDDTEEADDTEVVVTGTNIITTPFTTVVTTVVVVVVVVVVEVVGGGSGPS